MIPHSTAGGEALGSEPPWIGFGRYARWTAATMGLEGTSQLDRMIARLTAQRDHLEAAAIAIHDIPGPVLEIGLGKGRTYDHLRVLFAEREIFAFDGDVHAPPGRVPDADYLFVGDFRDTLPAARERLPAPAALAHADFGSEIRERDAAQAKWLGPLIDRLMAPGGVVISDRAMAVEGWSAIKGPDCGWAYFMWRVGE